MRSLIFFAGCLALALGASVDIDINEPAPKKEDCPPPPKEKKECPPPKEKERVWTFGFGRTDMPFEYFDEESGSMQGFGVDILREACGCAGKLCEIIGYKNYDKCWASEAEEAFGLNEHMFDGCVNWYQTVARDLMYGHSIPFSQEPDVYLYSRQSDNVIAEDLQFDNNYRFSFRQGWYTDPVCLRKSGISVGDNNIFYADNFEEQLQQLRTGMADLAFIKAELADGEFRRVGDVTRCSMGGMGVMTTKDNKELLDWLNPALQEVMESKEYAHHCYIAGKAHGGDPRCFGIDFIKTQHVHREEAPAPPPPPMPIF